MKPPSRLAVRLFGGMWDHRWQGCQSLSRRSARSCLKGSAVSVSGPAPSRVGATCRGMCPEEAEKAVAEVAESAIKGNREPRLEILESPATLLSVDRIASDKGGYRAAWKPAKATSDCTRSGVPTTPRGRRSARNRTLLTQFLAVVSASASFESQHHPPRFVRGQSILQRPFGSGAQKRCLAGVDRAWW
jgi:hypothetical protein